MADEIVTLINCFRNGFCNLQNSFLYCLIIFLIKKYKSIDFIVFHVYNKTMFGIEK